MNPALFDAHNHLQDERLQPYLQTMLEATRRENIKRMVVNGSTEGDWAAVLGLASRFPEVLPSCGLHPWYVKERSPEWQKNLITCLDRCPAGIGEIGLDRWIEGHDLVDQSEVFAWQLRLAAERNVPASIHCLQAWGKLLQILQSNPRPACGFLLHSFGGPRELVEPLAALGAYFSFPGYFAHDRKRRQRETFRTVPPNRLLIETDAPDQLLPVPRYPLQAEGKPLNHPANLVAVYQFAADWFGDDVETLALRVQDNFRRLFGGLMS